jgi:hypothetical protein
MAHKFICDGCKAVHDDMTKLEARGHVVPAIYCKKCLKDADKYLASLDKIHEKCAAKFDADLAKLRKSYADRDFDLPDNPGVK